MDFASLGTPKQTSLSSKIFREGCAAEAPTIALISPHKINNETEKRFLIRSPIRNGLYRYRSSHVRSLCGWSVNSSGDTLRGRFRDDVEQDLAHLARASPDRVALLILYGIDLSVWIQGKNHWFGVHSKRSPLSLSRAPHDKSALCY